MDAPRRWPDERPRLCGAPSCAFILRELLSYLELVDDSLEFGGQILQGTSI